MKRKCAYPGHEGDRTFEESGDAYEMTVADGSAFAGAGEMPSESREVPVCPVCAASNPDDPSIRRV